MPTPPDATVSLLLGTTAGLAAFHTLLGVDHSIPFIVLGRARGWSLRRTLGVTGACGVAHVASSVLIGLVGVALGVALDKLSWLESARGQVAASLMIGFGLAYAAWAVLRQLRKRPHAHAHTHPDGTVHTHPHDHQHEHLHLHTGRGVTPWALFLIFAFGPCEALIPLMMVPAVGGSWLLLAGVVGVFAFFTIGAMLIAVALGYLGLARTRLGAFERRIDVLAGLTIAASGAAVLLLGV
jgi:ABC-type nickel/cobalt efflux system permease component RcnA